MLGEEIENLDEQLRAKPPSPLLSHEDRRKELETEKATLTRKIDKATECLMYAEDKRTRKDIDRKVTKMRDDLERLTAQISGVKFEDEEEEDRRALQEWWKEFLQKAVKVRVDEGLESTARKLTREVSKVDFRMRLMTKTTDGEKYLRFDARAINEVLNVLGCKVDLRWETETVKMKNSHTLVCGRFRLGQKTQKFTGNFLQSTLRGE